MRETVHDTFKLLKFQGALVQDRSFDACIVFCDRLAYVIKVSLDFFSVQKWCNVITKK